MATGSCGRLGWLGIAVLVGGYGVPSAASPLLRRGPSEGDGRLRVARAALDGDDLGELRGMLAAGRSVVCCGHWRDGAAARLQERVAAEVGVPLRLLGDVHLSNSSSRVTSSVSAAGLWGAVAVLYLDDPAAAPDEQVAPGATFVGADGGSDRSALEALPGSLVVVPDGAELLHEAPHRVAWLHIRRSGQPQRSAFDYYFVAWVRAHFVAPYDTESQRRLFGSLTRYPRYWHGFLWSFVGMFLTVFACVPLAWQAVRLLDRLYATERRPKEALSPATSPSPPAGLPTLLSRERRNFSVGMDPARKFGQGLRTASEPLV